MRRLFSYTLSLFLVLGITAQDDSADSLVFEVSVIKPLDSSSDVILSYADMTKAIGLIPRTTDFVSNWNPDNHNTTETKHYAYDDFYFKKVNTQPQVIPTAGNEVMGTATFCRKDSTYAYCSIKNGAYSIYTFKNNEKKLLLKGSKKTQYVHPFIADDGSRIFFSSNASNPKNYDIYYLNKVENGWSQPVKLNAGINTSFNEVFPTWYNDTLYYSSSQSGNLELYASPKNSQYSSSQKLAAPFNSKGDDFLLHKINSEVSIISSDRKTQKDTPYLIQKSLNFNSEKTSMQGFISCSGNRISNIPLKLTTFWGVEIDTDISDSEGNFLFRCYKDLKNYKIKLDRKDPRTRDCAVIYLTDKDGNVIQKIVLNDEGDFKFELLDTDKIEQLNLLPLKDESLLQVNIDGQVFEKTPGDVGQGEPVKIVDEDGNLLALAYTNDDGSFEFKDLSPTREYNFNFDEIEEQLQLLVHKNGEVIQVPVKGSSATYERIAEEDALDIIDESGAKITIETNEFFEISNILYEFNSSELTETAKFQLDKLARLIFNNDEILIELTSHTDCRGKADFNLELSEKRVNSCINYLVSKGVKRNRLKGYGMGEKKPMNRCVDGIDCSEEEHSVNRRTEIRIVAL